ncbi:MAG: hypothetical protein ACQEP5_04625 [Actinomycetota bacterium]
MARYKRYIFIAAGIILAAALLAFISPIFTRMIAETDTHTVQGLNIQPKISHYAAINLKATNARNVQFPRGTAELVWGKDPLAREKFDILTDNLTHSYHIPLGENIYWQKEEAVTSLRLLLPQVEGIEYKVEKFSLGQRMLPPLDSYIGSYIKNTWQISHINRFLVPSYILLAFTAIAALIYTALFRSLKLNLLVILSLVILTFFSAYFFLNGAYTARSYWLSYKNHIQQRDLTNTYRGFYDFRKFILWVEEKLPEEQNLAVLLRGEPVYIMSEMAYSLYPRDIRFINISQKSSSEIILEISESSREGYSYIIILSRDDRIESFKLNLVDSYREEAGYIYRFSAE